MVYHNFYIRGTSLLVVLFTFENLRFYVQYFPCRRRCCDHVDVASTSDARVSGARDNMP